MHFSRTELMAWSHARRWPKTLLVSALLWLLSACAITPSLSIPDIVHNASASVVTIANETGSIGTGFIVAKNGLIATNYHIARKLQIFTILPSGKHLKATVVAKNIEADLAILRINATDLVPLELSMVEVVVGEQILALGNPFGLGLTVSAGIVSAKGVSIGKANRIQIDAAINPGNSGGPLLDVKGKVIGVVNSKTTAGYGVSFAIPAKFIGTLLDVVSTP